MRAALQKHTFWLVILPVAAFLRIYQLGGKQLWLDELIQAMDASLSRGEDVLRAVRAGIGAVPLDFLVEHYVIMALGRSEFSVRLHAALFGVLTLIVLYYLTRGLFDERTAKTAACLYAVYPLHHHYSQEG